MNNIPKKIVSGFDLEQSHDKRTDFLIDNFDHIIKILFNKSIIYATHYAVTAKRSNLSGMDMIYSLQYLAHEFINIVTNSEIESIISENAENDLILSDSDISNDDDSDVSNNDDSDMSVYEESCGSNDLCESNEYFTRTSEPDELCDLMNYYHDTWDSWSTNDKLKIMLKKSVDNSIKNYNV